MPKKVRNVCVAGEPTSMRLEPAFWDALAEITQRKSLTVSALCTRLAERVKALDTNSLSTAVRVYVMEYFRTATPRQERACCKMAIAAERQLGSAPAGNAQGAQRRPDYALKTCNPAVIRSRSITAFSSPRK
nr:ribbon-helix-helix domain-containing protein [Azospirillum brasilense]